MCFSQAVCGVHVIFVVRGRLRRPDFGVVARYCNDKGRLGGGGLCTGGRWQGRRAVDYCLPMVLNVV